MLADKKVVASAVNIRGNQEKMKARALHSLPQNLVFLAHYAILASHRNACCCGKLAFHSLSVHSTCHCH